MIKSKCVEFIDELLDLFEDRHVIYKRLIQLHHFVRNVSSNDDIETIVRRYMNDHDICVKIKNRNYKLLNGTRYELEGELMWSELTQINKEIIWKWLTSIIDSITESDKADDDDDDTSSFHHQPPLLHSDVS